MSADNSSPSGLINFTEDVDGAAYIARHLWADSGSMSNRAQSSGLFNAQWYATEHGLETSDSYAHYIARGISDGASPNPLFDVDYYGAQFPGIDFRAVNPLEHYLGLSLSSRAETHVLFDRKFYVTQEPQLSPDVDPLEHFLTNPEGRLRKPHPLFDPAFYLKIYSDLSGIHRSPLLHYVEVGEREFRRPHPLFDPRWYVEQSADPDAKLKPLQHFLTVGAAAHTNPHPLFDSEWYLLQTTDPAATNKPLMHFLLDGDAQNLSPHPLFDNEFYRASGEPLPQGSSAVVHCLTDPGGFLRPPHPLFDPKFYLATNPDVANDRVHPLVHYVRAGGHELRKPHPVFDVARYLALAEDASSWDNAVVHYLRVGAKNGLSPHSLFDPTWYLSQTNDPIARNAPLAHYVRVGSHRGLSPHPSFNTEWYRRTQLDPSLKDIEPLSHFLTEGDRTNLDPNPLFSSAWYRLRYPDVAKSGENALLHYLRHGGAERRNPHPAFSADDYLRRNPTAIQASQSVLVDALLRYHVGSDHVGTLSASHRGAVRVSAGANPRSAVNRFAGLPRHKQGLAHFAAAAVGDETAEKLVGYFSIIEELETLPTGSIERSERILEYVSRMRNLSAALEDERAATISIIIPAYNHVEYTIACLLSLLEHRTSHRYEVIVGNNISADETREVFESVGGIVRCITHDKNEGFIMNCNNSTQYCVGEYVVLLNNDAFIFDRWLDELATPFSTFRNLGLTGSKLINADGTLQEAGAIMWDDASGWNYGRGQDPQLSEYSYVKDVDFISGASIMFPKSLWDELGGFDLRYLPAYFDDSDLAFAIRDKGYRTLLAPASMIVHHEGVTHGTDTQVGVKAYQVENRQKFINKWRDELNANQFPNGENVFFARDRSRHKSHILIIDHYIPQFDKDAGSRTIYEYCKIFIDSGLQVIFWPDNLYYDKNYAGALQNIGVEVIYGPRFVDKFDEWIREHGAYIKYIFLSRPHIAEKYVDSIGKYFGGKVIFYGHDLHYARLELEYEVTRNAEIQKEATYWKELETRLWSHQDVIYYPSEEEAEIVKRQVPRKVVRAISAYVYPDEEIEETRERAGGSRHGRPSLMFVAGFRHRPNVDAALWLARSILPKLKSIEPRFSTILAGSFPPPEVMALGSDDIIVTGYVSDAMLRKLYSTTTVVVAPLRYGGGVKGKIVEALRFGAPIVTTSAGAQGMRNADSYLGLADTAEDFVARVAEILGNPILARKRALAGLDYIDQEYSYTAAVKRIAPDIPEVGNISPGSRILKRFYN